MSAKCRRGKRLADLAHDMFERHEIDMVTLRAVTTGVPPPCEDRASDLPIARVVEKGAGQ